MHAPSPAALQSAASLRTAELSSFPSYAGIENGQSRNTDKVSDASASASEQSTLLYTARDVQVGSEARDATSLSAAVIRHAAQSRSATAASTSSQPDSDAHSSPAALEDQSSAKSLPPAAASLDNAAEFYQSPAPSLPRSLIIPSSAQQQSRPLSQDLSAVWEGAAARGSSAVLSSGIVQAETSRGTYATASSAGPAIESASEDFEEAAASAQQPRDIPAGGPAGAHVAHTASISTVSLCQGFAQHEAAIASGSLMRHISGTQDTESDVLSGTTSSAPCDKATFCASSAADESATSDARGSALQSFCSPDRSSAHSLDGMHGAPQVQRSETGVRSAPSVQSLQADVEPVAGADSVHQADLCQRGTSQRHSSAPCHSRLLRANGKSTSHDVAAKPFAQHCRTSRQQSQCSPLEVGTRGNPDSTAPGAAAAAADDETPYAQLSPGSSRRSPADSRVSGLRSVVPVHASLPSAASTPAPQRPSAGSVSTQPSAEALQSGTCKDEDDAQAQSSDQPSSTSAVRQRSAALSAGALAKPAGTPGTHQAQHSAQCSLAAEPASRDRHSNGPGGSSDAAARRSEQPSQASLQPAAACNAVLSSSPHTAADSAQQLPGNHLADAATQRLLQQPAQQRAGHLAASLPPRAPRARQAPRHKLAAQPATHAPQGRKSLSRPECLTQWRHMRHLARASIIQADARGHSMLADPLHRQQGQSSAAHGGPEQPMQRAQRSCPPAHAEQAGAHSALQPNQGSRHANQSTQCRAAAASWHPALAPIHSPGIRDINMPTTDVLPDNDDFTIALAQDMQQGAMQPQLQPQRLSRPADAQPSQPEVMQSERCEQPVRADKAEAAPLDASDLSEGSRLPADARRADASGDTEHAHSYTDLRQGDEGTGLNAAASTADSTAKHVPTHPVDTPMQRLLRLCEQVRFQQLCLPAVLMLQ